MDPRIVAVLIGSLLIASGGACSVQRGEGQFSASADRGAPDSTARVGEQVIRPAARTASNINDPYVRDYLATLDEIDWLTRQKDLPGLEKLGDRIEAEWPAKNMNMYGYIMLELVGQLQQTQFGSNEHFAAKWKFAQLALQKADKLPLVVETDLVPHLGDELYGGVETSDRAKEGVRITAMGFWIHAINRVEAAVDPNWNADRDRPQAMDVREFRGPWPLYSGMSPDVITDPVVREKYVKAIEEGGRRNKFYTEQAIATRVKRQFLPRAENEIAKAYAKTGQVPELQRLLAQQMENKETREVILSMVKTMQESAN